MKKLILTTVSLFIMSLLFAQSEHPGLPNIITPSPNAYSLGKFGQIPVGLFTGAINENVPIFTFKTKNLEVPIALNYNSNGIKVDEISSIVGLGWNINVGGVITRIVRDEDDFKEQIFIPEDEISSGVQQNPVALQYFHDASSEGTDSEPDLFLFNFNGYTGSFVINYNTHAALLMPAQPLKVETYFEGELWGFRITAPDGVKYIFLASESTRNQILEAGKQNPERFVETAWFLSKITHPNGDEINFHYSGAGYYYIAGITETNNVIPNRVFCGDYIQNREAVFSHLEHFNTITGKRLDSITSNIPDNGKVVLSYFQNDPDIAYYKQINEISFNDKFGNVIDKANLTYLTTSNKRTFLAELVFKDNLKKYSFEYYDPSLVPMRLSFSQDHWGYFNNKSNSTLIPLPEGWNPNFFSTAADRSPNSVSSVYGLLKKVTYPTKGFCEIQYEPNTYYGQKIIPGHIGTLQLFAHSRGNSVDSDSDTILCFENQYVDIAVGVSQFINDIPPSCSEPNSFHNCAEISIFNQTEGLFVDLLDIDYISGSYLIVGGNTFCEGQSTVYAQLKKDNTYIIKLTARFCTDASITFNYYDQPSTILNTNIEVGGQRVKKTTLNGLDPGNNEILHYYYNSIDNLNISSGDPGTFPNYHSISQSILPCSIPCSYEFVHHDIYNSSSILPLFNSGNSNIYYKYVSISQGGDNFEKGGTEHEYIIHRDSPGNPISGPSNPNAPWDNLGWDNGLEKQVRYLRKDENNSLIPIKKIVNFYITDSSNYHSICGYAIRKKYDYPCTSDTSIYHCTEVDIQKKYERWVCHAAHGHSWCLCGIPLLDSKCISFHNGKAPDNHYEIVGYHPCFGHTLPYTIIVDNLIDNLDVMSYKLISWWKYLNKSITTEYDLTGQTTSVTTNKFYYDNKTHMQITREETENSKGDLLLTRIFYPDDVKSTTTLFGGSIPQEEFNAIVKLNDIDHHQIAVPVQKETFISNNRTSTTRYLHKSWENLILTSKIQYSIGTNLLEDYILFSRYDLKGNILEVKEKDNISHSYIYGYNSTYPIAETQNADTSECGYTGFENHESPGWVQFGSWSIVDELANAKTGISSAKVIGGGPAKYFSVGTLAGAHSGYKASVWVKGGTDAYLHIQVNDDYSLSKRVFNPNTPSGDWNLIEVELPYFYYKNNINSSLRIKVYCGSSGIAFFDDLRFHPMDAQMTSYTYKPLVGMTSSSDVNNKPTTYEYDGFGRLILVRDFKGNILKKNEYHYKP